MFADTWLLLQLRWHVAWNTFRHRSMAARVFSVIGTVVFAGAVGLGFFALGVGLGFVSREFPDPDLAALLPGGLLAALSVIMLLTSFGVALGTLFLANDLELLMSAPVDRRAVFLSKMIDGMVPNYGILAIMALPALIAFGIGQGWGPLYYLLVVVTLVVLPLLPAGLGAMLVLLVARVAPVRRVREILGFAGALFGIGCGLLGQTSRFWVPGLAGGAGRPDAEAALDSVRGWASVPLPPLMAGRGLASAGLGDLGMTVVSFGGFFVVTVGFFVGCVWVADRLYASGWVRMQSSGSAKRGKERSARAAARAGWLGRAPAWLAIALKDWRVIPRDLRNFAQILAPLALLPFVFFSIVAGEDGGRRRPGRNPFDSFDVSQGAVGVFVAAGILVAVLFVFGRIAETSISMEGKSWWLTKAAPLSPWEVLVGKLMAAAIPYAMVSLVFMVAAGVWRGFDLVWFLYGLFGVEMLGLGLLAVGVGLSVPWAKLDWDDPRKMLPWQTALLTLVAWLVMGAIGGGLLCLPFFVELFSPDLVGLMMLLGAALSTLVTGGVAYGVMRLGMQQLGNVGEA
jgi:ABC-2 type transport system permease protein